MLALPLLLNSYSTMLMCRHRRALPLACKSKYDRSTDLRLASLRLAIDIVFLLRKCRPCSSRYSIVFALFSAKVTGPCMETMARWHHRASRSVTTRAQVGKYPRLLASTAVKLLKETRRSSIHPALLYLRPFNLSSICLANAHFPFRRSGYVP
jgi:hypothetical protein